MAGNYVRLTINLSQKANTAMERAAEREGLNRTEIVNRALQVYDFIQDQVTQGKQIRAYTGDQGEIIRFF